MADYIVNLNKKDSSITLQKIERNITLVKQEKQIVLEHVGRRGEKGDQGIQGEKGEKGDKGDTGASGTTNLFIQDDEPTITEPSLWIETELGQAKTLWLVTED